MENQATSDTNEPIQDRQGKTYRLNTAHDPNSWRIKVFDGRVLAAWCNCEGRANNLFLADLHVLDDAPSQEATVARFARALIGRQKPRVNYRRRGLGSSLLRHIIRLATDEGFHRITGKLSPHDLRANPNLPNWYRRFGFIVEMQSQDRGSIALPLSPPGPNSMNS